VLPTDGYAAEVPENFCLPSKEIGGQNFITGTDSIFKTPMKLIFE
jgi:hypothetical protein